MNTSKLHVLRWVLIIIIKGHSLRRACLMGVKVGSNYVAGKFYIDDLSLMAGNIEEAYISAHHVEK